MTASLSLTDKDHRAFQRLASDLQRVFGPRFVALVACSASASVCFTDSIQADDLEACGALVETWHHEHLATPLLMTPDEFRRSLDAFPVEYQAILDRHAVIAGVSPFADSRIDPADLRRACEIQARGYLIHLRQGWLESAAHPHDREELVAASAAPLRVLLTQLARLEGVTANSADDLAAFAARGADMPADLVRGVLALEHEPGRANALAARLPDYLAAAERLWQRVDTWRVRARG